MTFALWWSYTIMPSGPILAVHRKRSFVWGYGHALVFASIAAVGAGLHLIGYAYGEHALPTSTVIPMIAVPVMVFVLSVALLHLHLVRRRTRGLPIHVLAGVLPAAGVAAAAAGWALWACLLAVLAGPVLLVVAYEAGGWRHLDQALGGSLVGSQDAAA